MGLGVLFSLKVSMTFLVAMVQHSASGHLVDEVKQDIDAFIQATMACRHIPGLVLSVVHRDDVIMERGYGKADVEQDRDATPSTPIPIASNTKSFTATLLAILLQNNTHNFTWDTPIKHVLGKEFQLYNTLLTEMTTLRDLMSHRTGIPDYFVPLMAIWPDNETRENLVRRLRYHKPEADFRATFRYNNYMFALAGYVAEVLAGAKWEDLIQKHIFGPLNMSSSTFPGKKPEWDNLASPYILYDHKLIKLDKLLATQADIAGPAGSIISSAHDMTKWLRFLLRGGVTDSGVSLLPQLALEETWIPHMPWPRPMNQRDIWQPTYPVSDVHMSYNLGWMTNIYRGFRRVYHSGSIATYKSQVWLYPDSGYGIFMDTNGPASPTTTRSLVLILQYISDALLGQPQWLNTSTVCSFPRPWQTEEVIDEVDVSVTIVPALPNDTIRDLHRYAGVYTNLGFGNVVISVPEADIAMEVTPPTETEARPQRLRMRMGQILEAFLYYNESSDVFYTNFTGKYWYMNDRIPLKFEISDDKRQMDRLLMPMHPPYNFVTPAVFVRGMDPDRHFVRTRDQYFCGLAEGILPSNVVLYISILSIAFLHYILPL